ncbi:MAG: glutaredoxin family protein [Proteobacteria bacterium]|nr:glutaredoxin family protein [Pseudomonadota bacterium]
MRSVIFAILLGVATAASAQLYRWTDEKGRVHVTDTPPPPSAKDVQRKTFTDSGAVPAEDANLPYATQIASKNFPVKLYTAPDCAPCGAGRKLLNARGVPFKEVSVVDAPQTEELRKIAGSLSVPTVSVGSSVQKGFEDGVYHALLDNAGYPRTGILPPRSQAEPKPAPPAAAAGSELPAAEESSAPSSGPYSPR